jgi:hypothetical protein
MFWQTLSAKSGFALYQHAIMSSTVQNQVLLKAFAKYSLSFSPHIDFSFLGRAFGGFKL